MSLIPDADAYNLTLPVLSLDNEMIKLIDKARDYFGLSDLEKPTKDGGVLNIHIGDVFIPSENLHRKYAGESFMSFSWSI